MWNQVPSKIRGGDLFAMPNSYFITVTSLIAISEFNPGHDARDWRMNPKMFVLDTYVSLPDARCTDNFAEPDASIPITVLEKIDKFKRSYHGHGFRTLAMISRPANSSVNWTP